MLGVTKKHHTENLREVRYIGPVKKIEQLVLIAQSLGLEEISETVPWRELFPEYEEKSEPGIALKGARKKESLTQKDLTRLTGIPQGHISQMELGKRVIGKEIAKKLGKALNVNYRIFL